VRAFLFSRRILNEKSACLTHRWRSHGNLFDADSGHLRDDSEEVDAYEFVTQRDAEEVNGDEVHFVDAVHSGQESDQVYSPGEPGPDPLSEEPEIRMPSHYKEMIGPVRPRQVAFSERHANFASEPRNEPWAFAMETGINDFIAKLDPPLGLVVEYVECRARTCEIAGYRTGGDSDDGRALNHLVQQPWWQGGNAISSSGYYIDGIEYFVNIYFEKRH